MQPYARRMDALELRHLRAFVAVVDTGGFTAAAASLRVSQAAVSRTISGLERALGVLVLHRTTREVTLSPAGARILPHARRMLEEGVAIARAVTPAAVDVRIGYAWAALGRHTTTVQKQWRFDHAGAELVFVQSSSPTTGLAEGLVDVAVLRRPLQDDRFSTALVGIEQRFAAVPTGHAIARRRNVTLADFAGRTVAIDSRTGTTTEQLWPVNTAPAGTRSVDGIDEWLTVIAADQAVGITSEAAARQHPRPGVTYRPIRDAQPVAVHLAWRRDSPPPALPELLQLIRRSYDSSSAASAPALVSGTPGPA